MLFACSDLTVEDEDYGTIRGVAVKDSFGTHAGITVAVQGLDTAVTTDSLGNFTLENVMAGTRVVTARFNKSTDQDTVEVVAGAIAWTETLHVDPLKLDTIPIIP
jgi:hypothetical protein